MARDYLEGQYDSIPEGPLKDMINLSVINWYELESHFNDQESDENEEE